MLPLLPRRSGWASSSLILVHPCQPSPKPLSGRPAHRPFRGLLSVHSRCGLHTRAVTKFVTVIRRLQTFRLLHACPGCFRLERSPGGPCTHWKCAALSRRTWIPDLPGGLISPPRRHSSRTMVQPRSSGRAIGWPRHLHARAAEAGGIRLIAFSVTAVIVSAGFTPGLAGTAPPSHTRRFW